MAELSPMMQQYLEIKKQHKDEILFYRIGDFYEMFFDDALTASRELDLTLTGKQCGLEERAPMCGVPFHSYEGYVARLISKGYKVAICEQVEDPAKAKGLVKRDIIRVVTPGTVIESSMLQDDKNNYIASIFLKGGAAGLCFADVSTGTAHITELKREKIAPAVIAELCRYNPSEVLMNPGLLDCREITAYIKKNMNCAVELVEEERYAPGLVAISLENQFGRDWAAKTGITEDGLVRFAMAALLEYLHDTQIKGVERLKTVITYNEAQFMRLSHETVSEIVDSLAKVFPVFLYFVAALVTFTTMTRFVSEERINNGTLKSLGYQDKDVIQKFVVYGFIAGMTGTVLGIVLGHTLLPHIVYNAYKHGFILPPIELHFYIGITILAVILSLISSVLPAYAVAKGDLQETTASLLQPKAPKAGSKILLERITPIWKRMKFTQKVTVRNIFRYKNRMFMTIFGVAGAASILFAGFSVKGSISKINEKQFENIIKYDMIVAQNDDLDEEAKTEFNNLLNSEEIKSYSSVYYEEVTKVAGKNNDTQSIKLIILENDDDFNQYISLADRKSQEKIELQDDGIVISERLAKLLKVSKGDEITFTDSSNKERTAKVSGICEMYAGHFIFMNTTEYKKVYQKDCESNAKLLLLNDSSTENTNSQAAKFMELSAVKGIVQNTTLYNQINTIVNSLNQIMIVLIIVASMLAVVILYNLTNINVAERIRELCTIKVLGFYDNEVTMYIYKETIFLSIIGVIVGWIIGILLHTYILVAVPPAEVMFDPKVTISSYIVPAVVIAFVTLVLKYYVNNRLKVVDMLEALKSVD